MLLTNDSNLISSLLVECPFNSSDHNVIRFSVSVNHDRSLLLDNHSVNYLYRDFSSADYDGMVSYLTNVDWFHEFTFVFTVEYYWQIFAHHLNMAIEAYVPLKKKSTHIDSKKAYPKRIKKMLNHKAHYWRRWRLTDKEEHKQAYKAYSVKCVQAIQAYYRNLENALVQSDNLGKFCRYVNGKISGQLVETAQEILQVIRLCKPTPLTDILLLYLRVMMVTYLIFLAVPKLTVDVVMLVLRRSKCCEF